MTSTEISSADLDRDFQVGDFLVRPHLKVIRRSDGPGPETEIRIPDKSMEVLVLLAANARRICSRKHLLDSVWGPDRAIYDRVLDNAIRDIRKAFDDSARDPRYVETIAKKGYRLIAPLRTPDQLSYSGSIAPLVLEEVVIPKGPKGLEPGDTGKKNSARRRWWPGLVPVAIVLIWYALPSKRLTVEVAHQVTGSELAASGALESALLDAFGEAAEACADSTQFRSPSGLRSADLALDLALSVELDKAVLRATFDDTGSLDSRWPWQAESKPPDTARQVARRLQRPVAKALCGLSRPTAAVTCYCRQVGEALFAEGHHGQAAHFLQRTVELDPDAGEVWELLAEARHQRGETELATAALEQSAGRAAAEGTADHLRYQWRQARIEGRLADEKQHLQELRLTEPENEGWSLEMGRFLRRHERDCKSGLDALRDALALDPRETHYAELGEALLSCGRPRQAAEALHQYAEQRRQSPDSLVRLATAAQQAGDYQKARDLLNEARAADRQFAAAIRQKGDLSLTTGAYADASFQFELLLTLQDWPTGRAEAHTRLARVSLLEGNLGQAISWADKALADDPDAIPALWIQGIAHLRAGRQDQARALLQRMRSLNETSQWQSEYPHHLESRLHLAQGNFADALRELGQALDKDPRERVFFLAERAEAYRASGDLDRAERAYSEVFAVNSEHPHSLCGLALMRELQGRPEDAEKLYGRALAVFGDQPEDPEARRCKDRRLALLSTVEPAN